MISFLSKLGEIIIKGAQVVGLFAPVLQTLNPKTGTIVQTVSADLAAAANIVTQIEAVAAQIRAAGGAMTSQQKLDAATTLIKPILLQSNIIVGRKIADPDLLTKAAREIAQGVVDLLQSVHPDEAANTVIAEMHT